MYDNHVNNSSFHGLRGHLTRIFNGSAPVEDLDELIEKLDLMYDNGKISSHQYDQLQSLIQDIEESV